MITIKAQEYAKNYDLLTTLPMRNLGERLTAELMQQSDGYLIFLDMDNLKKINDIHGHKAGDRALKILGNLLSRYLMRASPVDWAATNFAVFAGSNS
ncbi:MAG: diguanylate cyclase domain-containing protein [Coprococcus sp.]